MAVLAAYEIELIADVRRYPGSHSQPQYRQPALKSALHQNGIAYSWIPGLGGRRQPLSDTRNPGWQHPAFRGYADHIDSEEFAAGLFELLMPAQGLSTAIMCAEILWWRCHRRIIADVLVSLGIGVVHILNANTAQPHRLAAPARLLRGVLSYPAEKLPVPRGIKSSH